MCALYKIIIQILSKIISILIYKDYKDGDKSVLGPKHVQERKDEL